MTIALPWRLSGLPELLRDLAPDWEPYQNANLNGAVLAEILEAEPYRVKVYRTNNVPQLDPDELRGLLWQRLPDSERE